MSQMALRRAVMLERLELPLPQTIPERPPTERPDPGKPDIERPQRELPDPFKPPEPGVTPQPKGSRYLLLLKKLGKA